MRARTLKRLLLCLAVAFVGALVWITVEDFRPLDIRSQVSTSSVIAYGRFVSEGARSHIVIDEIWKHSPSADPISVGASLPHRIASAAKPPDAVVVFFSPRLLSRQLSPAAIVAVYGDRVPAADMSLSELKALCAASPST